MLVGILHSRNSDLARASGLHHKLSQASLPTPCETDKELAGGVSCARLCFVEDGEGDVLGNRYAIGFCPCIGAKRSQVSCRCASLSEEGLSDPANVVVCDA